MLLASVASLDFCGPLSRGETRCAVPTVAGPVERSCLQPACSEAPGLGMECPSPLPTQPLSWPDFPTALLRVPACSHCGGHPSPSPAQAAREMGLKLRLLGGSCPVPCVLPRVLPRVPEGRWLLSDLSLCPGSHHAAAGWGTGRGSIRPGPGPEPGRLHSQLLITFQLKTAFEWLASFFTREVLLFRDWPWLP